MLEVVLSAFVASFLWVKLGHTPIGIAFTWLLVAIVLVTVSLLAALMLAAPLVWLSRY